MEIAFINNGYIMCFGIVWKREVNNDIKSAKYRATTWSTKVPCKPIMSYLW